MGYVNDHWLTSRLRGKVLRAVLLAPDKESVTVVLDDGTAYRLGVDGDCCSSSWIEHLDVPSDVAGATVLDCVEDSMDVSDDTALNPLVSGSSSWREHECLQVYHTRIRTDRGEIVLEYRNSSNGYYGGNLVELK